MNTVHKTNKLTYKREEISERLSVLMRAKKYIGLQCSGAPLRP